MLYRPEDHSAYSVDVVPSKHKLGGSLVTLVCDCDCGTIFERPKSAVKPSARHYLSNEHLGAHRAKVYLEETTGPYLAIVTEYLDYCSLRGYKSTAKMRTAICPFVLFLTERGITDLEQVTPKIITQFLSWAEDVEYKSASHDISVLVGFFKWAVRTGYRQSLCPVVPSFHGKKRSSHLPRPYTAEEMLFIWELAKERGNARIRALIAIGEEAGLRLGEICRLRVQDIDINGRRLFVRLPNKGNCEDWALFGDKTAHFITQWLAEREEACDHDHLFHNSIGGPLLPQAAHKEMCKVFCKLYGGQDLHSEGLDQWSTHRLRHTMASNLCFGGADIPTIMAAGRWKSTSSMMIYTKVDAAKARRGYDEAMRQSEERPTTSSAKEVLSLEEFLATYEK